MVWWYTAKNHASSISGWVRTYLRSSGLDKLIFLLPVAAVDPVLPRACIRLDPLNFFACYNYK